LNDGNQLSIGHRVALPHQKLLQPALNFGADDHFIRRDDARQYDFVSMRYTMAK
jgi:hypothetical protein